MQKVITVNSSEEQVKAYLLRCQNIRIWSGTPFFTWENKPLYIASYLPKTNALIVTIPDSIPTIQQIQIINGLKKELEKRRRT